MRSPSLSPRTPWLGVFSRRTTWWVLGACLPVSIYALALKAHRIVIRQLDLGVGDVIALVTSDLAVLAMWWATGLGVRAATGARARGWPFAVLFQLALAVYAAALLGAQGYFLSTGSSLDYAMLAGALRRLDDTRQVIASASTPGRWLGFGAVLGSVASLPWLAERFAGPEPVLRPSSRALAALLSLSFAGVMLALSLSTTHRGSSELARDPFAHLVATAGSTHDQESDPVVLARAARFPRGPRSVVRTGQEPRKNLVIILLESTSAAATSLHGGPHATTPFLEQLAARATVAERAYTVVPHTSKALVASLCGLPPRPGIEIVETMEGAIFGKCLPTLLAGQGYRTTMMQSAQRHFENRPALARRLGFHQLVTGDELSHEGLEPANYFGFEDRILLAPVQRYLAEHSGPEPFFLTILTNTPHHGYGAPSHYGRVSFKAGERQRRYLNAVRYQDFFLRDLFAEFERAGRLADTVFVIAGDHGEAFGEHGLWVHDDIMYEECLRVPLLVLDPGGTLRPGRLPGTFSQLDIAPTALELLGFEFAAEDYPGRSLLAPREERVHYAACLVDRKCVARLDGSRKLIHAFGRKPDELYDLARDPGERHNLAEAHPGEVAAARDDALAWYRTVRTLYRPGEERAASDFIRSTPPPVQHPRKIHFGDSVTYLGWSVSPEPVVLGESIILTFHFRVREPLPPGMRLFTYAQDAQRAHDWKHRVLQNTHPEKSWRAGQYLSDRFPVRLPAKWLRDTIIVRGGFESREGRLLSDPEDPHQAPVLAELPIQGRSTLSEAP